MNVFFSSMTTRGVGASPTLCGAMIPSKSTSRTFFDGTRRGILRDGLLMMGLVGVGALATAVSGSHFVGDKSNLSKRGRPLSRLDIVRGGCPGASRVVRGGAEATAAFSGGGLAVVASSPASLYASLHGGGQPFGRRWLGSVLQAFMLLLQLIVFAYPCRKASHASPLGPEGSRRDLWNLVASGARH